MNENITKFLPRRKAEILTYAKQVHDGLSVTGFDPTTVGLTAADVTELATLITADQTNYDAATAARLDKQSKTKAMNAPGASHAQLIAKLRDIGNAVRVSDASDDVIASLGINRRKPSPTPKNAPATPPSFDVLNVLPGVINVRFRSAESGQIRARAANAIGVQIAAVNAANPPTANEADIAQNQFHSRSPAALDSTQMPDVVRLYARWITQRGHTSPWTLAQEVAVL